MKKRIVLSSLAMAGVLAVGGMTASAASVPATLNPFALSIGSAPTTKLVVALVRTPYRPPVRSPFRPPPRTVPHP